LSTVSRKGCYFNEYEISTDPTVDALTCGKNCELQNECTRFNFSRGMCTLMQGPASFDVARFSSILGAVCGVKGA